MSAKVKEEVVAPTGGLHNFERHFICPISQAYIVVPVVLDSGHTIDMMSLLTMIKAQGENSYKNFIDFNPVEIKCPLTRTNCTILRNKLKPVVVLRNLITDFISEGSYLGEATGITDIDLMCDVMKHSLVSDSMLVNYVAASAVQEGDEILLKAEDASRLAYFAAFTGQTATLQMLLAEKTELLDAKDEDGRTPAHDAAKQGKTATLQMLLAEKTELLDAKDEYGSTPAHYAAMEGHTETLQML